MREMDKLDDLYESLADARRECGDDAVPFHKFADLVKGQVEKMQEERRAGGGVPRGGEGRKSELHARAMKGVSD